MSARLLILAVVLTGLAGCAKEAGAPEATLIASTATASIAAASSTSVTVPSTATAIPGAGATPIDPGTPEGASVTISAVGDISLARQVVERMDANGAAYPFALIAPLITGDIGFANLEGALTDRGEPWPKGYNFRTPPRFAPGLLAANFDIVSLANNHAMDYGVIGLEDTLGALDAAGVRYAGAGANFARAWDPAVVTAHRLRVAFVACALTPTEGGGFDIHAWRAEPAAPGVAICDFSRLRPAIVAARRSADFVVVVVHAGDEYQNAPSRTQRALAESALSAGADVYLGAHAHVVQPVEPHGSQLIAWGLGNFIFDLDDVDLANIPEPRVSLILNLTLTLGRGVTAYEAVPVTQDADEDRPRPATAAEAAILQSLIEP